MNQLGLGGRGASSLVLEQRETSHQDQTSGQRQGEDITQCLSPSPSGSEAGIQETGAGREKEENDNPDHKETRVSRGSSSLAGASSQVSTSLNSDSQVDYRYLTFDTVLPTPNVPATEAAGPAVPAPPDLSLYVDPLRWPSARKNVMVAISCTATMFTAYTAGAYSPPLDLIAAELRTTRQVALLGVTTFCLGFAYAPMVLAPFSEINGRYPVFAVAGLVFAAFQAACGLVTTVPGMLLARLFKGAGGSVFSTMVGGVISDLYDKEARNTPMALFSGFVLLGTGLGPLVASAIVEASPPGSQVWKWVFWHQVIVDFILMVAVVTFFRESRGSVILSRKAKALNRWYEELEAKGFVGVWVPDGDLPPAFHSAQPGSGDGEKRPSGLVRPLSNTEGLKIQRIRWKTKEDEERGPITAMVFTSLTRPFYFLFTEPIVFFFSLWVSFAWAVLYLTFGSIPLVFRRQYGFSIKQSGYVFGSMIVASFIITAFGIYQDRLLKHPKWQGVSAGSGSDSGVEATELSTHGFWAFVRRKFPAESPESRLYFTCFTAALLPIGLYLFGFSAEPSVHWIVPTIAIGLATAGIYYIYLATFNYLADTYRAYASSALAAQSFCRNILGGVFPLIVTPLFTNLGEDAAGGVLGSIAAVLTVVPWVLVLFGETIRRRSKYAVALEKAA
ncbi:putative MFS multidrug transporter [Rosellinia necatrix]|uniref:Putative MFS multidrug transporter n=1 Tax=Rosellinia necatrix TaxID=77044 RepID=A0A1S7UM75_ROSNE|nr:putative MFS multidrug transporter [Rosellinia necatrix]